jgi:hypothetical protein
MYRPPAVTWQVKPARWHATALMALFMCAVLLFIGFCVLQGWGASSLALLLALLGGMLMAARGLKSTSAGHLNWDGTQWQWHWLEQDEQAVYAVSCVLDLQTRMLVFIHRNADKGFWVWLESDGRSGRWQALRRAMVASKRFAASEPADVVPKG